MPSLQFLMTNANIILHIFVLYGIAKNNELCWKHHAMTIKKPEPFLIRVLLDLTILLQFYKF